MKTKAEVPQVPPALADAALIDGPSCAASAAMSVSSWLELVRQGKAPRPVIREHRFTRWRLAEIRAWLTEYAQQATLDEAVIERSTKASAKAQAKRKAAQGA